MVKIKETSIENPDSMSMIKELSDSLAAITGCSGNASFDFEDMNNSRAVFVLSYKDEEAVGCGAIREYSKDTAEMKRIYSKYNGLGIGTGIIKFLEHKACLFGYSKIILETRKININAVNFYLKNGYKIGKNYGKYVKRDDALCFYKML